MFKCDLCNQTIGNVQRFLITKNARKEYSCFRCFIASMKPAEFDEEKIFYPLADVREIQEEDQIVLFDDDGNRIGSINLKGYMEGFLGFLKEELADDPRVSTSEIYSVIIPYDIQVIDYLKEKEPKN